MERASAEVRVPAPVTAELVAHSLREAVKFVLFLRQQMPYSYDDFKSSLMVRPVDVSSRSRRFV